MNIKNVGNKIGIYHIWMKGFADEILMCYCLKRLIALAYS